MRQSIVGPTGSLKNRSSATRRAGRSALLLGFAIFGLLWILYILTIRENYSPTDADIPALVDGSLLARGARWQDWFTRGYSHFWDLYPDSPTHGTETAFTRPAFQFLIYLTHFALGRDWASYQLINCFAVGGMGAIAFQIAQAVLRLRTGPSLVAAMLVVLSPPVLESWLFGIAFAIEPLATILVAGAFLAVLARRDFLCLALLFLAILTKENAVWAPVAAAITVMLRPKPDETLHRRALIAAAMLLPVAMWLGLRFAFFGGIGGTFATAGYTPVADFLRLTLRKLTHMHYLFITGKARPGELPERGTALLMLDRGTALLIYALLSLWALHILAQAGNHFRYAVQKMRWPTVDATFLVALWAALALAFHFALPLSEERYATSVVVFAWPALVAEVDRRGKPIISLGLAVLCIASLTRSSFYLVESIVEPVPNAYRSMNAVLRQTLLGTRQIYVLSAGGLELANPEYVRASLGVSAEIVRVVEIIWHCRDASDYVAFDHSTADGVVSLSVTLPLCANFKFFTTRFKVANGSLYRNDTMSYELPEADLIKPKPTEIWPSIGRKMTVHVRPNGPARFIIEHGRPNGIAFFDAP